MRRTEYGNAGGRHGAGPLAFLAATLSAGLLMAAAAAPAAAAGGRLGVQVAGVGSSLVGELPEDGDWRGGTAFGYGVVADLEILPDVALSFQPAFSPRRSRQEFKLSGEVIGHYDYEIDYLSLPLLLRVTGDPVGTRGFVTAGLNLNVVLDASIDTGAGGVDITDLYRRHSLGALFGAGVMVPLGRNLLTVELRYDQGLDDIIDREPEERDSGLGSPSVKYRGLSLLAGFLFSLGGG